MIESPIGNLLHDLPDASADEVFETILTAPGLRVERIVSSGQASPTGFWYDQPQAEWVVVLSGSADLLIDGEPRVRRLEPGDHVLIPAGRRHRVESTDNPTIWLAVHIEPKDR